MYRFLLSLCLFTSSCCCLDAQEAKLTSESVVVLTGVESPRVVADKVVAAASSKIKQSPAMLVSLSMPASAQLIFIDFEKSDWTLIQPPELAKNAWVLTDPGKYRVTVLASLNGSFLRDRITLEVVGPRPPPVVDPVDPPPATGFDDVKAVTVQAVKALADTATQAAVKRNLIAAMPKIQSSVDLNTAQIVAVGAIEDALREREGESLKKDWLGLFRRPLNAKLTEASAAGRVPTQKEYAQAIAAVVEGL